jgi:hypothetical protein
MNQSDGTAGRVLRTAEELVTRVRGQQNGDKERSFEAIARLWNAYLACRKDPSAPLGAKDVAWMMTLLKVARSNQGDAGLEDHYVDACGYAAIAGEIALWPR